MRAHRAFVSEARGRMANKARRRVAMLEGKDTVEDTSHSDLHFFNPFEMVETLYWQLRNSDWHLSPDEGGLLDQDATLMTDIATYHEAYEVEEARLRGKLLIRPRLPVRTLGDLSG